MSGVSPEFWRATGPGYGVQTNASDRDKRQHLALCDGTYCERAFCERGKAWRATQPGAKWKAIDEPVQTGVRPEAKSEGQSERREANREAVRLPVVPVERGASAQATGAEQGKNPSLAEANVQAGQDHGPEKARSTPLREGVRPGPVVGREKDRKSREGSSRPETVSKLQAKADTRHRTGTQESLAFKAPRSVGRPRKHVDDRAKNRAASRAYRSRRGQAGG
jgi:hypothetical protein